MMREEIIARAFATIDRKLRPAAVAEIGGFRPSPELTSWFGGNFVLPEGEPWPESRNGVLVPLLQIRVSELPYVPDSLGASALVQVYVNGLKLPPDQPAPAGSAWTIKVFKSLDGLSLRSTPSGADQLRPFPVRWHLSETEAPSWDDAWGNDRDHDQFLELEDAVQLFYTRYQNHAYTKIGGWPFWIQGARSCEGDFVMQIASEEKPCWMLGDNGSLYIFNKDGDWSLVWDCY